MATNVYFSPKHRPEQNLYEDLVIESLKMYGQDVYYMPRQLVTRDEILNDDFSKFVDAYAIEMYIETTEGFAGEGDLLQRFGVEIRDQATFVVSKRRWEQLVGVWNNSVNNLRPSEGDLIYLPLSNSLFEIRFVEHEQPFYQLSNLPVYKLECELFEYGGEELETGVDQIDAIEHLASLNQRALVLNLNGTGSFEVGETVIQNSGAVDSQGATIYIEGELAAWDNVTGDSVIIDEVGRDGTARKFYASGSYPLVGEKSGASYIILSTDTSISNDVQSQNDDFEDLGDNVIDFTETNPFGSPGDL